MSSAVAELYAPLIERDIAAIPAAVRRYLDGHSPDDLFLAVARFAVLSYAPSQHAKHALLATLAAHDLRHELRDGWIDLLTECAKYAAQSRQPWSEPPMLDPPEVDSRQRTDLDELRAAIADRDRLRAERWLAGRIDDPALPHDLFRLASEDLEDLGHKLIVASAAWKLSAILGQKGRFATLRVAVWEMVAYAGEPVSGVSTDPAALLPRLVANSVAEGGSLESAHAVFLFDAAAESGEPEVLQRVCAHLGTWQAAERMAPPAPSRGALPPPIYILARDYAQYLKSHAAAKRLRLRFPHAPLDQFVAASHQNLEQAPSFEEWSFA